MGNVPAAVAEGDRSNSSTLGDGTPIACLNHTGAGPGEQRRARGDEWSVVDRGRGGYGVRSWMNLSSRR